MNAKLDIDELAVIQKRISELYFNTRLLSVNERGVHVKIDCLWEIVPDGLVPATVKPYDNKFYYETFFHHRGVKFYAIHCEALAQPPELVEQQYQADFDEEGHKGGRE